MDTASTIPRYCPSSNDSLLGCSPVNIHLRSPIESVSTVFYKVGCSKLTWGFLVVVSLEKVFLMFMGSEEGV